MDFFIWGRQFLAVEQGNTSMVDKSLINEQRLEDRKLTIIVTAGRHYAVLPKWIVRVAMPRLKLHWCYMMLLVLISVCCRDVFCQVIGASVMINMGLKCQWMYVYVWLFRFSCCNEYFNVCLCVYGRQMYIRSKSTHAVHRVYSVFFSFCSFFWIFLSSSIRHSLFSPFSASAHDSCIVCRFCPSAALYGGNCPVVSGSRCRRRSRWLSSLHVTGRGCESARICFLSKKSQKIFEFWHLLSR